ncbi:synaptonemal complex protein 2 [Suricata suricatta]|uniref:synaptonemal complex protein 2 n=1 Tax=Suricata suricatta TaxID=37032 RepID=UPI0011557DD2|nr:synaptonemal complex protein 2 [Suricata suricatta]
MIEDLFDLFMAIHDISDEGKRQIVESFVPRICVMVIDSRVNICIQQETLKKMNAMLDKMPQDARKILSNQEMFILMSSMGERILDAGDYDLQVGIVEALCRMTTEKQRRELACRWFSMDFVANAFKGIKDSEFETDCRVFLNLVNGMLGDKRRVFTFPCLSAFLDKYELKIPSDEKLEEFWIDFNLGSQSLSFYIAGDNDDHQWEAVTVPEGKVQTYSIEVRESKKLLTIILKNIIKISKKEGKELLLYFDASLEIASVTQKIFGANKYREFTRKQGISVAKTSVHILFDAHGSQILVPESQISPMDEELISLKEKPNSQKEFAKPLKGIKNSTQGSSKTSQPEITTPSKRKMSEASMIVPGTDRYTVRSPVLLTNTPTPRRRRIKPPLHMMSSAEKPDIPKTPRSGVDSVEPHASRPSEGRRSRDDTDKQVNAAKVAEKTENDTEFPNQNFNELQDTVPDSQTVRKIDQSVSSGVLDDICGNKMNSKWSCWAPVTNITLCNNRRAGDTSNQDIVINKKLTTQKSSSSISDDCEETEKVQYKKKTMHHNEIDTVEEGVCEGDNQQQLNHPQLSEQKNIENTKQNDWRIESETTLKSVLLNKTVEESLIYRKKYILSKDVKTAVCDKSPSPGKNMKSHRKSGKRLTSKFNSWDLEPKKMREKSKEKGFTDAAESLINQLNKRYKPKDDMKSTRKFKESLNDGGFSSKSDLQLSKEKVQKKSYRQLKTTFVNVTSECPLNDVYNFNLNGADEPVIKLGIQEFQATATEACVDNSIKLIGLRNHDELEPSLKTKDKRIVAHHKRKNLFSDSDTERKTDISWLKGPKPKPPLVDYSRDRNAKKRKSGQSRPSLERGQSKSKMTSNKNTTKKVEETVPYGRTRLPRRATKTKKNYKDLSNSESESEQEFSHSFKEKLLVKEENIHSRRKTRKLPKKQKKAFSAETQKDISKEWKNSSLLKDAVGDRSLGVSPASLSGSASSIEVMRGNAGIEEVTEKRFAQDYDCVTKSVSPYLKTSSPESLNSTYGSSIKSPENNDKNLCARERCSPIPRSCSLGNPSASPLSMSSEGREQIRCDIPCDSTHISGPIPRLSRKPRYIEEDDLSDADVVELEEEEEGGGYLLPRTLSRTEETDNHTYRVSESISPLSTNDLSPPAESWESEISDTGMMREKLNTEFRKEFPNCQKSMEYFIKQSWQTTRRHLNAVNRQIQEYRIKKLDKFQFVIIEELENFEKDSQSLKDLEKEFVDFGEKLFQKFSAYQKSERQRLRHLKTSLAKNVFYNPDHEDTIFKSQMCSLKEDMRALQEGLLKDVQEEELLKVRRGLLSLFMAHERNLPV